MSTKSHIKRNQADVFITRTDVILENFDEESCPIKQLVREKHSLSPALDTTFVSDVSSL